MLPRSYRPQALNPAQNLKESSQLSPILLRFPATRWRTWGRFSPRLRLKAKFKAKKCYSLTLTISRFLIFSPKNWACLLKKSRKWCRKVKSISRLFRMPCTTIWGVRLKRRVKRSRVLWLMCVPLSAVSGNSWEHPQY